MKVSKTTIYRLLTIIVVFYLINTANCGTFKNNLKKQKSLNNKIRSLQATDSSDGLNSDTDEGNSTVIYKGSSSGLSAGGICAIAIPCIAALVGVGAAAAILGGSAPAAAAALPVASTVMPVPVQPAPIIPEPINVVPPQVVPQVVEPPVIQPPPQPVQPIIKPSYPIHQVQPIVQQPVVAQPQMVPVQQMQLVPVQQVEMVPVQKVEMVPVQEVVPVTEVQPAVVTQQFAPVTQAVEAVPQVTQVTTEVPQMGIQGSEFLTAPEGYGTSVIQGAQQTGQVVQNIGNIENIGNNVQMGVQGGEFGSAPQGYGTSNIQGIGQTNSSTGLDFSLNGLI